MVETYERLRADVIRGQARPEGLGAVIYHGLIEGLTLLCSATDRSAVQAPRPSAPPPIPRELLRLLTNMVLQTQSEVMHVY